MLFRECLDALGRPPNFSLAEVPWQLRQIKERAEKAEDAARWIKVEERLPKPFETVEIIFQRFFGVEEYAHGYHYPQVAKWCVVAGGRAHELETTQTVIAWRALPPLERKQAPAEKTVIVRIASLGGPSAKVLFELRDGSLKTFQELTPVEQEAAVNCIIQAQLLRMQS
jgi:hypothetical protein